MRADERSDRTGEVNSHNAAFASESGRKTIFYVDVVVVFSLSPGRTQSAPKRVILAWRVGSRVISHRVLHISRGRPFLLIGPSRCFICGCRCTAGTMDAFITGICCGEQIAR